MLSNWKHAIFHFYCIVKHESKHRIHNYYKRMYRSTNKKLSITARALSLFEDLLENNSDGRTPVNNNINQQGFTTRRTKNRPFLNNNTLQQGIATTQFQDCMGFSNTIGIGKEETINLFINSILLWKKNNTDSSESLGKNIEAISDIDRNYCNLLTIVGKREIFKTLILLFKILQQDVTSLSVYYKAIDILKDQMLNNGLNAQEIVQLIYFISMQRKQGAADMRLALKFLGDIDKLSLLEQCIVAESAFKTAVSLKASQIQCIENVICEQSEDLVNDTHLLVALCKALRHAGVCKHNTLNKLSHSIINSSAKFDWIATIHILLLYADIFIVDSKVLQDLVTHAITHIATINKTSYKEQIHDITDTVYNPKYLDGLLISISRLNYDFNMYERSEILTFIYRIFPVLLRYPDRLTSILLSLQILDCQDEQMLRLCFEKEAFSFICQTTNLLWANRLRLLLNCIRIELPNLQIPNDLTIRSSAITKINEPVKTFCKLLKTASNDVPLKDIEIHYPIKALHIPGISCKHHSLGLIHIDILDESVCLNNTIIPNGFMKLKLRLLKKLGYLSILVDERYTTDGTAGIVYIKECISKISCKQQQ